MLYVVALIFLVASLLSCNTKKESPSQPANAQTKLFCDNIHHFESFHLCRTEHEIGLSNQKEPCPILWDSRPELGPDQLPDSKALKDAIDKDCKVPSGDCNVANNTCTEEEKTVKQGIINCIHKKVQSFKQTKCPHL